MRFLAIILKLHHVVVFDFHHCTVDKFDFNNYGKIFEIIYVKCKIRYEVDEVLEGKKNIKTILKNPQFLSKN